MKIKNIIIAGLSAIFLCQPATADDLVIMHTNDVHGNIVPEKTKYAGGLARRKVVIDSIRNTEEHSLLVDAGDDVQGFLYFTAFGGEVEYGGMNKLGYDIVTIGNHEFDNGLEALAKNYKILKAEKICANYNFDKTPLKGITKEYVIKKFDNKKIAFIGVGCQPEGMILPGNRIGMEYKDAAFVADSIATMLKSKGEADYVIVLSHIGYTTSRPNLPCDSILALNSKDIDIIIGGHSHTRIDSKSNNHQSLFKNKVGKTVLVAQTGSNGEYLGKITIDLDDLDETPKSELIKIDARYDDRTDPRIAEWLKPYDKGVEEMKQIIIGKSAAEYPNRGTNPLSNWVADKIYEIGETVTDKHIDFAISNKGGIRKPLPKGDISLGLIHTMLPFENYVNVIELDGKSIKEAFDIMGSRDGDAVSKHVKVTYKDKKAVEILIDGEPLKPSKTYTIATISYLYEGGDNMEPLTRAKLLGKTEVSLKYSMIDIIKEMTKNNQQINPDPTPRMFFE